MNPAAVLAAGGVLAFATESSYGLGVDPRDPRGVESIYRLKGRERGKPLPVVAADLEQLLALGVDAHSEAWSFAVGRWPAAVTVVLPVVAPIAASAGTATLAARVPDVPALRELLLDLGHALTATSANRSGEAPLVVPGEVERWLASEPVPYLVMDSGPSPGGLPSTLVELRDGEVVVLREGRDAVR